MRSVDRIELQRAKAIGDLKVCALDDNYGEWLDEPVRCQVSGTAAEAGSGTCAVKDQGYGRPETPRGRHRLTQ